jgi:hypothetical protein
MIIFLESHEIDKIYIIEHPIKIKGVLIHFFSIFKYEYLFQRG